MAQRYADRCFVSINGTDVIDVQSASLKQNRNAKAVPSMTRNRWNAGYTEGNTDIDITVQIALKNQEGRPKFDFIDYETNDVQITFQVGVDLYVATGVYLKDAEDNASGIGDEVKATYNFGALKLTDPVGNPAGFDLLFGN